MTRILVFSDSHHYDKYLRQALRDHPEASWIFHLGDGYQDLESLPEITPKQSVVAVRGNSDMHTSGETLPQRLVHVDNTSFLLCHGHQYQVKWTLENLQAAAKEQKVNVALYGHTHVPLVEYKDGLWLMNPGSIGMPRQGGPSYGIIDVEKQGVHCHIVQKDFSEW